MRMWSKILGGTGVAGIWVAAMIIGQSGVVQGETTASPAANTAAMEPTTGTPVQPAPGSETVRKDPFVPFDVGPTPTDKSPKPLWAYDDLSPSERAVVDRRRDTAQWVPTHNAFATAVADRARVAAAASAQSQLGVESLGELGVIP